MQKKMVWEWEVLDKNSKRIKVIGGWIVYHESLNKNGQTISESFAFVPDTDHLWTIIQPKKEEAQVDKSSLARDFA